MTKIVEKIEKLVLKHKPYSIDEKWIRKHSRKSHKYILENNLSWDSITRLLDRSIQRKWNRKAKKKKVPESFNDYEVENFLSTHSKHLYVFVVFTNEQEFELCDYLSIQLVRMAQSGNICASETLLHLYEDIFLRWKENDKLIIRYRSYEEKIHEHFFGCVRRYRYSGSFIGYLKRTLQLQALTLPKIQTISLNTRSKLTGRELHETLEIVENF
jgi:hypothetical protein